MFVRLYAFLSQVLTFTDVGLEKFYQYTRHLLRKLKLPKSPLPVEITENINMESYRIQQTSSGAIKLMKRGRRTEANQRIGDRASDSGG